MIAGIRNNATKRINPTKTIMAAVFLLNLFESLSTIGLREQAITNDAKNSIIISVFLKIKTIKTKAKIKNTIFLVVMYFGNKFSNIFIK
jgi:hypothetical protein